MTKKPWQGFYTIDKLRSRCVIDENDCWVWQGAKSHGYGTVGRNQTGSTNVHKVMYILHYGKYSGDVQLDHLCRNRACCNPDHLELVTHLENMRRGVSRCEKLTECHRGHPFVDGSYYVTGGRRVCKQCNTIRLREYRQLKSRSKLPENLLTLFAPINVDTEN